MRLGKIQVVVLALVCLLVSAPAPAQFGKLSSMVKDKMGGGNNDAQNASPQKGTPGEAKATFAPGVTKGVNVKRQGGGTPEASMANASAGRSQTITVKISGKDARQFDTVRAYSPCNKVSNFQIQSATQVKVTLDLTGVKSGSCQLYFRTGGSTVFSSNVAIR
jgi:hypothetical protein